MPVWTSTPIPLVTRVTVIMETLICFFCFFFNLRERGVLVRQGKKCWHILSDTQSTPMWRCYQSAQAEKHAIVYRGSYKMKKKKNWHNYESRASWNNMGRSAGTEAFDLWSGVGGGGEKNKPQSGCKQSYRFWCEDVLIEAGSSVASDNLPVARMHWGPCTSPTLTKRASAGWSLAALPSLRGFPPLRAG